MVLRFLCIGIENDERISAICYANVKFVLMDSWGNSLEMDYGDVEAVKNDEKPQNLLDC